MTRPSSPRWTFVLVLIVASLGLLSAFAVATWFQESKGETTGDCGTVRFANGSIVSTCHEPPDDAPLVRLASVGDDKVLALTIPAASMGRKKGHTVHGPFFLIIPVPCCLVRERPENPRNPLG